MRSQGLCVSGFHGGHPTVVCGERAHLALGGHANTERSFVSLGRVTLARSHPVLTCIALLTNETGRSSPHTLGGTGYAIL